MNKININLFKISFLCLSLSASLYSQSYSQKTKEKSLVLSILDSMYINQNNNHPDKLGNYLFTVYSKMNVYEDSVNQGINYKKLSFLQEKILMYKYDNQLGKSKLFTDKEAGKRYHVYSLIRQNTEENSIPDIFSNKNREFYEYVVKDTINLYGRKTYEISYKSITGEVPKKGLLYIDANTYAFAGFKGEDFKRFDVYTEINRIKYEDIWYTTDIKREAKFPRNNLDEDFVAVNLVIRYSNFTNPYNFEKTDFSIKDGNLNLSEIEKENLFSYYRNPKLTEEELDIYPKDLLEKEEEKINKKDRLSQGYLRIGMIDWNFLEYLHYNDYEGFAFKLALQTNDKFNKKLLLNQYISMSTKDSKLKFGIGAEYYLNKDKEEKISLQLGSDVAAAGQNNIRKYSILQNLASGANSINNDVFFSYKKIRLSYEKDLTSIFNFRLSTDYQSQKTEFDYYYKNDFKEKYELFNTSLLLKISPFSKYINTNYGNVSRGNQSLDIYLNYSKSWDVFSKGFNFNRFDISTVYNIDSKLGNSSLTINGGTVIGETTLINLYEGMGAAKKGGKIGDRLGIKAYERLETMISGEFFSDKYVSFFFSHNFSPIIITETKKIYLSLIYNGLIGDMDKKSNHKYVFKTPEKYYQEIGIELNRLILNSIGFGAYYRLGAYNSGNLNKDLFLKINFKIPEKR